MSINYLAIVPEIKPEKLKEILDILPEPKSIEIQLNENFDYSFLKDQLGFIGDLEFQISAPAGIKLRNPTKEKILDIYTNNIYTKESYDGKKVNLKEINWFFAEPYLDITLTPFKININYKGKQPDLVSKLLDYLSESDENINIQSSL